MSPDAAYGVVMRPASLAEVAREPSGCHKDNLAAARPQAPSKVVLYSHDTFGLGHLRRNLAIAERLLAANGAFDVCLLTGSPVIHEWALPHALRVQPLPPVVKTGPERYASRDGTSSFGMVKGYREALILKTLLKERPDFFLVDHAPAGMNGELLSTLALIRREMPFVRTLVGLRDILDSPEVVRKTWLEQDIYALLEEAYDDILIYGNAQLFDVAEGYAISPALASRIQYCGHIVASRAIQRGPLSDPQQETTCWDPRAADGRPVVLVTVGGGGDGYFLMEAYLKALDRLGRRDRFYSVIVTGPLMSPAEIANLKALAGNRDDAVIVKSTTNLVPSLRMADLVVAMAGYNTSAEIVAMGKHAILVPRTAPRAEQRLRAALLKRLGVVWAIEPSPSLVDDLASILPQALDKALLDPHAQRTPLLDLHGADRLVKYLESITRLRARSMECIA